jgi:hypothetical protein
MSTAKTEREQRERERERASQQDVQKTAANTACADDGSLLVNPDAAKHPVDGMREAIGGRKAEDGVKNCINAT